MKNSSLVGQVDLLALVQASIKTIDEQTCIIIPVNFNPSIIIKTTKNGDKKAYLNIAVNELPSNMLGNTHFIKAQIDSVIKKELSLERNDLDKYAPVIGNLKSK